jgi:pimeloyl-ACP methyl ester carboxylesterase
LLLPEWSKLKVPATVIQGDKDDIVPSVNFEFAKSQLKNKQATFIFVSGAGHLIRRSHPHVIKEVLLKLSEP